MLQVTKEVTGIPTMGGAAAIDGRTDISKERRRSGAKKMMGMDQGLRCSRSRLEMSNGTRLEIFKWGPYLEDSGA